MATTFNTSTYVSGAATSSFVARTFNAFTAWNNTRITRKELSALTARELEDIGITRSDIANIAARSSRF